MTAREKQTINISNRAPHLFTTDVACGECGELSTLVYSRTVRAWILMHENADTDENHKFYPQI